MTRFLDRHAVISPRAARRRDRLMRALGRSPEPPFEMVAAVLVNSEAMTADLRRTLTRRLADLDFTIAESDDEDPWEGPDPLRRAVVEVAGRSVAQGDRASGLKLIQAARIKRPRIHEFEPPTSPEGLTTFLLAALVNAAATGRPISLIDVAPIELDALVTRPAARKTPEAYKAALDAIMARKPARKVRRGTRKTPDGEQGQRWQAILDRRLPALVGALGGAATALTSGDAMAAGSHLLKKVEDLLDKSKANGWAGDRRVQLDALKGLALAAFRCASAVTPASAEAAADAIIRIPSLQFAQTTQTVAMFARRPEGRVAALRLAAHLAAGLTSDTSVDTKLSSYGSLARAVWMASEAESRALFFAGLQVADAFSSDDEDDTRGLVGIAAAYHGPALPPEIVYGFARLCEAQMSDDEDRFDWASHAKAMSRIGGLDLVPVSSRLLERGRGGLANNHLMALAALVDARRLGADLAAPLMGLFEYTDLLEFRLPDFLEPCLEGLAPEQRSMAIGWAETEIDRRNGASTRSDLDRAMAGLAERWLPSGSPLRARLETAAASHGPAADRTSPRQRYLFGPEGAPAEDLLSRFDLLTSEGIDRMVANIEDAADRKPGRPVAATLDRFASTLLEPESQLRFLNAVEAAQLVRVADKIYALEEHVPAWTAASLAVRQAREPWLKALARRHAAELARSRWDGAYTLRHLLALAPDVTAAPDLISIILARVASDPGSLAAPSWLGLARFLVDMSTAETVGRALTRYVALSTQDLPAEIGDGPWSATMTPATDEVEVVAGLLWTMLGSPDAHQRWRAAHAVRRCVDMGRRDVFDRLMSHISTTNAGPFQAPGLPFFWLNARLWLLVTVARIGLDAPECLLAHRDALEGIAFSTTLPHVLIREVAGQALLRLSARLSEPDALALIERCATINAAAFPPAPSPAGAAFIDAYTPRPKDYPKRTKPFRFDYEFNKYEIVPLARLFATSPHEAGDRVADWVQTFSPGAEDMSSGPSGEDWSGAEKPVVESFAGHLAWHGLFLAAGTFLRERPVRIESWGGDPLASWITQELISRSDGRWVADDTGLVPRDGVDGLITELEAVPRQVQDLCPLVGLSAPNPQEILVDGRWTTRDGVDVWVRSAFVPEELARNAAIALALSQSHDVWVPRQDDVDEYRRDPAPFLPWLNGEDVARTGGLDSVDPYAASAAQALVSPNTAAAASLSLTADMPLSRLWRTAEGDVAFQSRAWGGKYGRGRNEENRVGSRAVASVEAIRSLSRAWKACLVLVVFSKKYIKGGGGGWDARLESRWAVIELGADGRARPLLRIPARARLAVKALEKEQRREFDLVLAAVAGADGESEDRLRSIRPGDARST